MSETIKESPTHPYFLTERFHHAFGHPVRHVPLTPSPAERMLRAKLVLEEAVEFAKASGFDVEVTFHGRNGRKVSELTDEGPDDFDMGAVDVIAAADALADLNVVVNGSGLVWGFPMPSLDWEIFGSNMSKLGPTGKPIYRPDGKIVKGPNFRLPDVRRVLLDFKWVEQPPHDDGDGRFGLGCAGG